MPDIFKNYIRINDEQLVNGRNFANGQFNSEAIWRIINGAKMPLTLAGKVTN